MFAEVLQQYTNRVSITLPDALCEGNCTAEVIAPGWDIECSQSSHPYRLATYDEIQELASSDNTFENGTQRPNSTYSGPENVQTVFEVRVDYNFTASDIEEVADVGGRQVSRKHPRLCLWHIAWTDPDSQFHLDLSTMYKSTTGERATSVQNAGC
jgi:hypothetical protein